ncbi:MAG: hypothetical protein PHT89_10685, partial [Lachnospiraceae bacterium]|nr:hypothetical protein [Lachnospiraceae bacterium]
NLTGSMFAMLPFGNTMLGMNVYTSAIVSLSAFISYIFLKKKLPEWIVFLGIFMAESLCWCPTIILYNYLTYLFFTLLIVLLYMGLTQKRVFLFWAGIILGLNVMVRFPNLAQAALILSVWYYGWLRKDRFLLVLQNTLLCIGGLLTGLAVVLAEISIQYGLDSYISMISHLFNMSSSSGDGHSLGSMLFSIADAYFVAFRWLLYPLALTVAGLIAFYLVRKNKVLTRVGAVLYFAGMLLLLRLLYGRGMFNLKYYTYESMFQWVAIFLILSMITMLMVMLQKEYATEEKVLACMILLIILVTPLGSDNYLYPIMNNLFLIAPVTFYWMFQFLKGRKAVLPVKMMLAMIIVITLIQSTAFGYTFVFRDGTQGEALTTEVTQNRVLKGMKTSPQKAAMLESVTEFADSNGLVGKEVILYGNIPAMSCFLEMPAALTTSWPDLATYRVETMKEELDKLIKEDEKPVIIFSAGVAAWMSEDLEEMTKLQITPEMYHNDEKVELIRQFIMALQYQETYANDSFVIYTATN